MKKTLTPILIILLILLPIGSARGAQKDIIVIAQGVDPTTLDPHNHLETPTNIICLNIFDTLLKRSQDLRIEPLLAESYRLLNDTTWEFNLKKGVKFHNEEDFNSSSVKFSLERAADPKNKFKQTSLQVIDRVDIIDDYTVRVITKTTYPYLDSLLGLMGCMLPPKYVQEKGSLYISTHPIGTGPYELVRWVKDDQLILKANAKYFRGVPTIKNAIFRPIPEIASRVAGLQSQELDIVTNIPPHFARLMDWKGRSFTSKVPGIRVIFMAFDVTKGGPVADKRVRQAIAKAIDLDTIIKNLLEGNAIKLGSLFTKYDFGYDSEIKPHAYNPEAAKNLLKEAGYAGGFDLILHSPNGRYLNDKEVAEAVVGYLQKIGINATVRTYEWGTYMSLLYGHKAYPAYILGWGDSTFDADHILFNLVRTGQPLSNFINPQLDFLIDQGRNTMDKKKRQKIYADAAKLIQEEVPMAFVYQQIDIYGVNERVNWKPRADELLHVFDMSFKK